MTSIWPPHSVFQWFYGREQLSGFSKVLTNKTNAADVLSKELNSADVLTNKANPDLLPIKVKEADVLAIKTNSNVEMMVVNRPKYT